MVIVFGYPLGKFVNGSVYRYGIFATTIGTTLIGIPDRRIHRYFRTDLFPFSINAYFTQ